MESILSLLGVTFDNNHERLDLPRTIQAPENLENCKGTVWPGESSTSSLNRGWSALREHSTVNGTEILGLPSQA